MKHRNRRPDFHYRDAALRSFMHGEVQSFTKKAFHQGSYPWLVPESCIFSSSSIEFNGAKNVSGSVDFHRRFANFENFVLFLGSKFEGM